jgi:hypothetical protein
MLGVGKANRLGSLRRWAKSADEIEEAMDCMQRQLKGKLKDAGVDETAISAAPLIDSTLPFSIN